MAILTFPATLIPSRSTWGIKFNSEQFTSPITGTTQTVQRLGARWKATLEFTGLSPAQGGELDAFLAALGGRSGRFFLYPHHRPGNVAAGVTSGALAAGATTCTATGYTPNAQVFKAGDYVAIGGQLKILTAPATANSSGAVTLQFAPPMRSALGSGLSVVGNKPTVVMMLDSDEYLIGRSAEPVMDSFVISCSEAL